MSSHPATRSSSDPLVRIHARGRRIEIPLTHFLEPAAAEDAERLGNRWIKALRHGAVDGQLLRDRFTYRGDSLWWFTELYLHKRRTAARAFSLISAFETLLDRESPDAMAVLGDDRLARWVGAQVARGRGVRVAGRAAAAPWTRAAAAGLLARVYARAPALRRWRQPARGALARGGIAVFVHTAFWKASSAQDTYIGPVLDALSARVPPSSLQIVGVGPATSHRARTWRRRFDELSHSQSAAGLLPIEALAPSRVIAGSQQWWRTRQTVARALLDSVDLRAMGRMGGYDLWPFVAEDLEGVAALQFPWSVRAMDEAAAAFDRLAPEVVVTYAEAGGWGRALVLEARRRGIPTVGLQHGFISRHWLNYQHEADELVASSGNPADRGCPLPDLTLLYDDFAREHLRTVGRYPPERLRVTGNPRLEAIVAAARALTAEDLKRAHADAGARAGQHLVVLAAKHIPEFDATFAALIHAVGDMPDVHLAIRPHPAETAEPYVRLANGVPNVTVVPHSLDPVALLSSARLVATINSTVALEALALGVPALAMRLPNYLSPFVDAGVIAGTSRLDEIGPTVAALVREGPARQALATRRRAFVSRLDAGDGAGAAERAAETILRIRESGSVLRFS